MPGCALATKRSAVATGAPSIRTSPSRAIRASCACAEARSSVTSCRYSVPPRAAAMQLSAATDSRSVGRVRRGELPNSRRSTLAGSPASQRTDDVRRARRAAALVQFAGDGFDVGAGFGGDQRAAVDGRAAPDQLLDARDRRRSADQFDGAVAGPDEPRGSRRPA